MALIMQMSLLVGSTSGDVGGSGSSMSMLPSDTWGSFIEGTILTYTTSYTHTLTLFPAASRTCVSINSLKDAAISAVCQWDQMQQRSNWEGFAVWVIKVVRHGRYINSGGIRSLENIWFGVNWKRLKSKQNVFTDVGGYREEAYRRVMSIILIRLVCHLHCSLFTLAVRRIRIGEQKLTQTQCTIWSFFKQSNVKNPRRKDVVAICSGMTKYQSFLSLTFRSVKSLACSSATCCAAHKYLSGGTVDCDRSNRVKSLCDNMVQ